jgi:hypothetical protein
LKRILLLILTGFLLQSCSFFGINKDDRIYLTYYEIIDSWVGRPIEELLLYWGKPIIISTLDDKPNFYKGRDKYQTEYIWSLEGYKLVLVEKDCPTPPHECIFPSNNDDYYQYNCSFYECEDEYKYESVYCDTAALVDKQGHIIDIKPKRHNESKCQLIINNRSLNLKNAPENY